MDESVQTLWSFCVCLCLYVCYYSGQKGWLRMGAPDSLALATGSFSFLPISFIPLSLSWRSTSVKCIGANNYNKWSWFFIMESRTFSCWHQMFSGTAVRRWQYHGVGWLWCDSHSPSQLVTWQSPNSRVLLNDSCETGDRFCHCLKTYTCSCEIITAR